jgi:hypothetical protein
MQVSYGAPVEQLRVALEARGFTVTGSGATLRIVRRSPVAPAPATSPGGGRP